MYNAQTQGVQNTEDEFVYMPTESRNQLLYILLTRLIFHLPFIE